jgi:hypothetical protein
MLSAGIWKKVMFAMVSDGERIMLRFSSHVSADSGAENPSFSFMNNGEKRPLPALITGFS